MGLEQSSVLPGFADQSLLGADPDEPCGLGGSLGHRSGHFDPGADRFAEIVRFVAGRYLRQDDVDEVCDVLCLSP